MTATDDAVREGLGRRTSSREDAGAAGRCSTSICTSSTRSRRRRPSTGFARAGSACAGRSAPSRRWTTRRRRCRERLAVVDVAGARRSSRSSKANCAEFGVTLYDLDSAEQGIVHVIGPELGLTQPGMTIVCGDSHTSTHGAFGALAFGIGTSEVEHVLATQCLLQRKPKTLEVRVDGRAAARASAPRTSSSALIAKIGVGGATGHVIEYRGDGHRARSTWKSA